MGTVICGRVSRLPPPMSWVVWGRAFNRFLDKLQPLIGEVGAVTGELSRAASGLSAAAAESRQVIQEEHLAVDQVTTAATQMSAAVHEVARNAQASAEASRQAG